MVLNMDPYRKQADEPAAAQQSSEHGDELALILVWVFLGCLLVVADVGQSEPWGAAFSLGMLMLLVALGALWRQFITDQRSGWKRNESED
jgi:protein-S-isoprenylcysteine O-methyltransferase Ste14